MIYFCLLLIIKLKFLILQIFFISDIFLRLQKLK